MKDDEEFIKRVFLLEVPHLKWGGEGVGLVWRIMMLGKSRITKQLDYVDFIINYLKKRKVEGRVNS